MSDEQSVEFSIPRLNERQAYVVITGLFTALQRTLVAYANALGPDRIDELSKLKASLVDRIKNAPISGVPETDEADAVLALFTIVEQAFPVLVNKNGGGGD
jgi:hypothetical protein